jgi:hypothetical protein
MPEATETTTTRRRRAGTSKNVLTAIGQGEFDFDESLSYPKRAAAILIEAAKRYPLETIPWRYLFKAITGLDRLLTNESPQVLDLAKRSQAIRDELEKHPHCGLVNEETGVRCTTNDADYAEHVALPTAKRWAAAGRKLQQRSQNFNPSAIPASHTMKRFGHAVANVAKELRAADFETKLRLPPKPERRKAPTTQTTNGREPGSA